MSLPFLKPNDVSEEQLLIIEDAPELETDEKVSIEDMQLIAFLDYFVVTWLENDIYPIELWNCYKERHRTNNASEGKKHG